MDNLGNRVEKRVPVIQNRNDRQSSEHVQEIRVGHSPIPYPVLVSLPKLL